MTPTQRSLAWWRQEGYTVAVVEKFLRFPGMSHGVRQDLFGFADLVAIRADKDGVVAIQCGVGADHAKHVAKIHAEPRARIWLSARNRILVDSWRKVGDRGQRKIWAVRQEEIY